MSCLFAALRRFLAPERHAERGDLPPEDLQRRVAAQRARYYVRVGDS